MSRAVIFDLNGVFIISPFLSVRFHDDFGVPEQDFLAALKHVMGVVRMPDAPDVYDCWKPYFDRWGVPFGRDEFLSYAFGAEKANEEMIALAKELKAKGLKLFVLSNNYRERAQYYANHFPFLNELFEHVYYSWQTGYVKPDPRCFTQILEQYRLKPEECFYFDDSEENVRAASSLGIHAHKFTGAEVVHRILS